jgi:DNA primase
MLTTQKLMMTERTNISLDLRAVNVRNQISIFHALQFIGVRLIHGHSTQQIICPFHDDTKPSARVYQDSGKLFCFTCHKLWDSVSVVMESKQVDFPKAIEILEEAFKLQSPLENLPLTVRYNVEKKQSTAPGLHQLSSYVEERILAVRKKIGLKKFCKYLTVLDLTAFYFQNKKLTEVDYRDVLKKTLSKLPTDV